MKASELPEGFPWSVKQELSVPASTSGSMRMGNGSEARAEWEESGRECEVRTQTIPEDVPQNHSRRQENAETHSKDKREALRYQHGEESRRQG